MATPQQQVDGYLGEGWHAQWVRMDKQANDERNRFDVSRRRRLHISEIAPLYDRVQSDLDILNGIATDYRRGIDLVMLDRRVAKDKIGIVYRLYSLALGVVENENNLLDTMFASGFLAAWVSYPFLLLQVESLGLLKILDELVKALREAEVVARNVKVKTAIHLVVTIFEEIFKHVSVVARAGILLGEVVVDLALGPPNRTTTQKVIGIVPPGVKQVSEAIHHAQIFGEKTSEQFKSGAGGAKNIAIVATFYIDIHEWGEASERIDKIEELLKSTKKAYDDLHDFLEKNDPKLKLFLFAYERMMRAIEDSRLNAAIARKARDEEMARAGYDPRRPMAWPISP